MCLQSKPDGFQRFSLQFSDFGSLRHGPQAEQVFPSDVVASSYFCSSFRSLSQAPDRSKEQEPGSAEAEKKHNAQRCGNWLPPDSRMEQDREDDLSFGSAFEQHLKQQVADVEVDRGTTAGIAPDHG